MFTLRVARIVLKTSVIMLWNHITGNGTWVSGQMPPTEPSASEYALAALFMVSFPLIWLSYRKVR